MATPARDHNEMTFAAQLRALVEKVGGTTEAAKICGVTRQSVNRWLRDKEAEPCSAMQAGAIHLLGKAKPAKNEPAKQRGPVAATAR